MIFPKISKFYVPCSMLYCGIRKFINTSNVQYKSYTYDQNTNTYITKKSPVLVSDRIIISTISGITGMYIAPICVINDIRKLEIKMRGLEKDYLESEPLTVNFYDLLVDIF